MVTKEEILKGGFDLKDPIYTDGITLVGRQEEVIREWARQHGYKDLRGFHSELRSRDWSYYDVLKEAYK